MEATDSSATLVYIYGTSCHHVPEDSNLYSYRHENLKCTNVLPWFEYACVNFLRPLS